MGNNENLMKSLNDFFSDKARPEYFAKSLCLLISKADLTEEKTKEAAWLTNEFVNIMLSC